MTVSLSESVNETVVIRQSAYERRRSEYEWGYRRGNTECNKSVERRQVFSKEAARRVSAISHTSFSVFHFTHCFLLVT
jgi:hypothetical protein